MSKHGSYLKHSRWQVLLAGLTCFSSVAVLYAQSANTLDEKKIISSLSSHYGDRAKLRGQAWFKMINRLASADEKEKLEQVNRFFNMFRFIDDIDLWGEKNYWATPIEFIGVNGGDCEDYSIAKFFTLRELGIPDEKLRITMVKALSVEQYHMVLAYYETPRSEPVILDNLDGKIKPASKRKDLIPVYSFNASQLWLNKHKGPNVSAGKSSKLKQWQSLRERITHSKFKQPKLKTGY